MVYLHLATGFEETEAMTILDMLRRGGVEAASVSMTGEKVVRSTHGVDITCDVLFEEADYEACEMIVLPGGMPGSTNLMEHKGLAEKILNFVSEDKWTCAICAAPMVYGHLGILEGKKATIFPGMEKHLVGADVKTGKENAVVQDGKIITSQAPGTAMFFGLKLVEALKGEDAAKAVRDKLYIPF